MHPLYQYRLAQQSATRVQQFRPKDHPGIDAPAPWRTVRYFPELDEILDAKGFTVAVCRPEHAARIIAAVNGVEKGVMSERLNISYCAGSIAAALLSAGKAGILTKIGIDDIRAAVVGYLAGGPHILTKYDTESLIEATLRKTAEKAS